MTTTALSFSYKRKKLLVQPEQIIRLEGKSNYTWVHFTDHAPILMAKVLHAYDEILRPHGFVRTHRSHLVNTQYVKHVGRNGCLEMNDASIVEVSRSKRREVMAHFNPLFSSNA